MAKYNSRFYSEQSPISEKSANEVIPWIIKEIGPKSVIDVGCGVGTWLLPFSKNGVNDYLGIDNHELFKNLTIPREKYLKHNLVEPILLSRKFDLAISLEVAEHLPETSAKAFIDSLTSLSDIIIFSAAIPFQAGTGHLNCHWPEYWIQKFSQNNFEVFDIIRPNFWNNPNVGHWYAQNMFLFIRRSNVPMINKFKLYVPPPMYSIIHPKRYLEWSDVDKFSIFKSICIIGQLIRALLKRFLRV